MTSIIFITRFGVIWTSPSSRYQPPTIFTCSISRSASTRRRVADEAELVERVAQRLGVVARRGVDRALLELDLLGLEPLGHPEVEEGDPPVVHQQVVAGVGVGVEVLQVVDRAEAEAEDDLAEDVALVLVAAP